MLSAFIACDLRVTKMEQPLRLKVRCPNLISLDKFNAAATRSLTCARFPFPPSGNFQACVYSRRDKSQAELTETNGIVSLLNLIFHC